MSTKKLRKKSRCTICHQRKEDVLVQRVGGGLAHDTCLRAFNDRRRVAAMLKTLPSGDK